MRLILIRNVLVIIAFAVILSDTVNVFAQEAFETLNLQKTIEAALKANLAFQRSKDEISAAKAAKNAQITQFLPTLSSNYSYLLRDKEQTQEITGTSVDFIVRPRDTYTFVTSFSQPIFTGFALTNQYKIASLGLDVAEFNKKLVRQDVILDAKNAYFSILKTQKLVAVADDTVRQITSQKDVAENMYQVGMSPLNDLLQSQVQLANAKQAFITANNNLELTKSQFNTLLRRPVNHTVVIADILDYRPFDQDINYCLSQAEKNRLEIQVADLEVEISQREVKLAQGNYYPTINLTGVYNMSGTDWDVAGGEGISDEEFWEIQATATWEFWQWGRTVYGVKEKLSRLSQAKSRKEEILDNINLEVKQAYLKTKEAEKNITTVEKAIEQAKENLRITEERYKEQVSTTTDVLVAQTLLTETQTNYFNALYDFKIAKAILYRAIGQEIME